MDWCVDLRVAGAASAFEDELHAHLSRHASEPALVELARPMVRQALDGAPRGPMWLSVDWEEQEGRLRGRSLADVDLPGTPVGPGVTRAQDAAAQLIGEHGADDGEFDIALNVARIVERDIDAPPADPGLLTDGHPHRLLGLIAGEIGAGRSVEEAAARAGATVAALEADRTELPADAGRLAEVLVEAERRLGADFDILESGPHRAVVRNRRCPFGPTTRSMCRFTSALAGGLAARATGQSDVNMLETLAAGDLECRLVVETAGSGRPVSHRYTWPPPAPIEPEQGGDNRGFQVSLSMQLPRDRLSVPVTRHLIRSAMTEVGVVTEDADAVELAVTEACANVIDHSGPGDAYDVSVSIGRSTCHIRVVDVGRGFDSDALSVPFMADTDAEHGRGVALMHALVDQVRFESEPERGTVVHLVKRLRFEESSTARRMMMEPDDRPEPAPPAPDGES